MVHILVFITASVLLLWVSRASLRDWRSHGFYRFFAWEAIVILVLMNLDDWFSEPFSLFQVASWLLLSISGVLVLYGIWSLSVLGGPQATRVDSALVGIEKTTQLVTVGAFHYIRHPLYSSLLFLNWGTFCKAPSWAASAVALAATVFLAATAKVEEVENVRYFGPAYREYMSRTKMFIPFLF
jgi:protein-S-isoprenylcysteine O-methyltransferase Ste14